MSRRQYFMQIALLMLALFLSKELLNYFTLGEYAVPYGQPYPIYAGLLQAVFLATLVFSFVQANRIAIKRRKNSNVDTSQTFLDCIIGPGGFSLASFFSAAATIFIPIELADLTSSIRVDNVILIVVLFLFFIPMLAKEAVENSDPREVTP